MNMFYYHWLKEEASLPYCRAEHIKAGNLSRDRGRKKEESRTHHVAAKGEKYQKLPGRSQTLANTQINNLRYKDELGMCLSHQTNGVIINVVSV